MEELTDATPFPSGDGHDALALSFADLYAEQFAPMVRLAVALTGSEAVAEDLVHDAFVRVHPHYHDVRNPVAYLRRAVVNGCKSAARRSRRERAKTALEFPRIVESEPDELFDALSILPYRQRAALVLQFYGGQSQAEIADILGCREGTVASLVHRGLAQLRKVIDR